MANPQPSTSKDIPNGDGSVSANTRNNQPEIAPSTSKTSTVYKGKGKTKGKRAVAGKKGAAGDKPNINCSVEKFIAK